jgi:hypothetical protein
VTAIVKAEFSRVTDDPDVFLDAEVKDVTIYLNKSGDVLQMVGGPTGFESFYVSDFVRRRQQREDADYTWLACFGTKGSWSRCVVPSNEMKRALKELGVIDAA